MAQGYNVYANDGDGSAIDYSTPTATVDELTASWLSGALAYPGIWRLGIRAFNASGHEERNRDQIIEFELDASGNEVTAKPNAPGQLAATPAAGGAIKLTWQYSSANEDGVAAKFNVYGDNGLGVIDYATPLTTVNKSGREVSSYSWTSGALTDGQTYRFAVRSATSADVEEANTIVVTAVADATDPEDISNLAATASR